MIKTWQQRCEEHPDHEGIVTEQMIRDRMQEEIDELRQALAQPEQERLYTEKDIVAVVEAIVTSFDLRRSEHLRHLIEAKLKEKNSG